MGKYRLVMILGDATNDSPINFDGIEEWKDWPDFDGREQAHARLDALFDAYEKQDHKIMNDFLRNE